MTPEKKVKKIVTDELKSRGIYYFYPVSGGYGSSGVPDIICCYRGFFVAFECKAGKNKTTALQEKNIDAIIDNGGIAMVVTDRDPLGVVRTVLGFIDSQEKLKQ